MFLLSLMGLRPAEVSGLKWSAVDLDAQTLTIDFTRTLVAGKVVEKDTKSEACERTLPLPSAAATALKVLRLAQEIEASDIGAGVYGTGSYVLIDEIG